MSIYFTKVNFTPINKAFTWVVKNVSERSGIISGWDYIRMGYLEHKGI